MGKVGERGEVAKWERWLRGVRWQDGKGGGERSGSKVGKVGERGQVAKWERGVKW